MLPRTERLRRSEDFRRTIRRGVRVGRPTLVVHADFSPVEGPRVGFVVAKAVGNAVTRNRVKRRLRHLAAGSVVGTPARTDLVIRALPRSATAPDEVVGDLSTAWSSALRRLDTRGAR
jgi:ribonuclease P protein component